MEKKFTWTTFSVTHILPVDFSDQISVFAEEYARSITLHPTSITSRELRNNTPIEALTVDGIVIKTHLNWLYRLYEGAFYDLCQLCFKEQIFKAKNPIYAINLNIQKGDKMRYECHVDSNPITGLLYVTTHPKGSGGELVIANSENARGERQIEENCERIYPIAGDLIFFNGSKNPHFVKPLNNKEDIRIAVPMNFYTNEIQEEDRPIDLNLHVYGV